MGDSSDSEPTGGGARSSSPRGLFFGSTLQASQLRLRRGAGWGVEATVSEYKPQGPAAHGAPWPQKCPHLIRCGLRHFGPKAGGNRCRCHTREDSDRAEAELGRCGRWVQLRLRQLSFDETCPLVWRLLFEPPSKPLRGIRRPPASRPWVVCAVPCNIAPPLTQPACQCLEHAVAFAYWRLYSAHSLALVSL